MHIKQIVIEGFKSYKEQVATEPFSSKVNCVVGANGSGKTNFFHAIRFVLSDLFQNLRNEDRHALLHEGAGHQVVSAFVEIVFDNSDNRIPVDKEEVRLRRTIGAKKDEYFLDGKHITKTEVMNLLESAGFSRSNPYYVVQQGKIASLTLMKDSERLDLLKEIGGTRVYEERRRESLKIMQETGNKRKQIIQVVQYLDERLKELDEEKEELRKYQQLDKQRKSLEYAIYNKEVQDAQQKLTEIEDARAKISETSAKMYNDVLDAHEKSKDLENTLKDVTKELNNFNKEKEVIEKRRTEALKKHTELELDVKDLKDKISGNRKAKEDAVKQLGTLEKEIQDSMNELDKISPSYEDQIKKESAITKRIKEREKQLSILYQKQGRATQFSSKAARDKWLQKEIEDLKGVLSSNTGQEQKLMEEIDRLNGQLHECDECIMSRRSEITTLESLITKSREGFNHHKEQRDNLHDERKSLWAKENQLTAEIDKLRAEKEKAEKSLDHAIPGDVRRGLNSVRKICREYKISGVHGPIMELLNCDEKFFTAVEVTAGNSLFHVVVDNDETSTQIIRHLNSQKGGRVTFIPLNRVKAPRITYPQSSDVIPLLKKLNFKHEYTPAFSQVFARTVICKNLDVASRVARNDGLDCITLEGDQVSKKGSMTGGFYDHRRSKLKFMNIIKQNEDNIYEREVQLNEVRSHLKEVDDKITKIVTEQQKIDAKRAHDKSEVEQLKQDIANANKQKQLVSKAIANKEKSLVDVQNQIDQLKASMAVKQAEMGTELIDHLTLEEKKLLSDLNPEIKDLKEKLVACKADRVETETRKSELETNLTTNLRRRKQELEAVISSVDADFLDDDVELKGKEELSSAKKLVDDATTQLRGVSESIKDRTSQIKKIKDEMNKLKSLEDDYERRLQEEAKELEQLLSKKNIYSSKEDEYTKKIRELGPLTSDAFEAYKRRNIKDLHKMLHRCNEQLQQFSHVNKKALDQYINFTEQREELQKRQAELDAGDEKIRELISVLDQRKDESIERTFKGVARHFREVFSELVQGGHGHLVMMKKKDNDNDDDQDEDGPREANPEGRVEKYIGVKVKVSFTGQGETQSMKQLSGGQKTVVALTLIFAIQRCDPAPFYLFDEIDAALDPQYRTAVGNMIRRLADIANTQFITTTFRPELVKVADKIYGVTHKNRVSRVNVVSKEDALEFIEHDQTHNAE
ncbi:PREDICTED: structural maintenance of chromosomes protein 3 [Lupinus angustifolius]|uniref:structural maintenance of chromosomes protein 3 n=1 Tax=Lupinus angustifolius TaxID=3871 RepID=UPI00092F4A3F|nr:PREDICTED: structural maintenance of chromosomes protein 3 [Lupinus angustifolius]XP_019434201.1 PREDICTED: structural maintenance of chromosomes protein 3 [Lupinus angustifolius]XP_019434210.1 PREDICTED: structural maintenance of chromosomes protein 3 [Lupinus angustifolius]XP_019434217.1 PREDICTED: structural maintenance of chromosomes protein 3 [Lupinus angustifolius]